MPLPRRSGAYMSAAAARESITVPIEAPIRTSPQTTATMETDEAPRPVSTQHSIPKPKPPASTGARPKRSIALPAGKAARAAMLKNMAGPSPTSPSRPVTDSKVIGATAAESSTIP